MRFRPVERTRDGRPGGLIAIAGVVARRRDVGDAFRLHGLNRLRDHAVLEERLVEIAHVVNNDFAAGGGQRKDAVGEVLLAVESRIEGQAGTRGDVVDDLHHRAPLVGAARSEVFDHIDIGGGWQRSVRFVRGSAAEIVEAVGEHADPDAGTVDAQSAFIQGLLHLCRGGAVGADGGIGDWRGEGAWRGICETARPADAAASVSGWYDW